MSDATVAETRSRAHHRPGRPHSGIAATHPGGYGCFGPAGRGRTYRVHLPSGAGGYTNLSVKPQNSVLSELSP